jgi:hypothetical protein
MASFDWSAFTHEQKRRAFGVVLTIVTVLVIGASLVDGDDGGSDAAAPDASPSTTAASTTTTIAYRAPSAAEPLRILVAGDSLVGWIAPALEAELAGQPVQVIEDWKGSSGLVRPDFFDWPARIEADVAEHDPEVVIVGFGGNDAQNLLVDGELLERGSPGWQEEYQRRVAEVLDLVEGPGRTLYWIGMPLTEATGIEEVRPAIAGAVEAEVAERPWAHAVDTMDVLAPDGTYQVFLPGPDGEEVRVRADDGVHPSPEGGRFIVRSFLDEVLAERGLTSS